MLEQNCKKIRFVQNYILGEISIGNFDLEPVLKTSFPIQTMILGQAHAAAQRRFSLSSSSCRGKIFISKLFSCFKGAKKIKKFSFLFCPEEVKTGEEEPVNFKNFLPRLGLKTLSYLHDYKLREAKALLFFLGI